MLNPVYLNPPAVRANLVQGPGGVFVDEVGSSRGISNRLDLDRLLALRELCDVLVTDGETARLENYRVPKGCDLAVITRTGFTPRVSDCERKYLELHQSPAAAIAQLRRSGYSRLLLEVGPAVLRELVLENSIDQLCLTNTLQAKPMLRSLGIKAATLLFEEVIEQTTFSVWGEIRS